MKIVSEFYEKYPFPGIRPVDQDGLVLLRSLSNYFQLHTESESDLRILDAGCGTGNTSISLAKHFHAQYVGIDISKTSLEQAQKGAKEEKIRNLHFRQWNLMDPLTDEEPFDIILCLGVLHHTADMKKVLINLRSVLKPDGDLYLWIYGKHGRYRHSLNKNLLNILIGIPAEIENPLHIAKEFALTEKKGSIMVDLIGQKADNLMLREVLGNDVWIADQFLNPIEEVLDMEELINLSNASGFEIKKWLGINDDLPSYFNSSELAERLKLLTKSQKLIALDLLLKLDQYFVVLEKVKTKKT
jgi:ubiquinone/menaquinone biosynthesis C-methylase UbiE